MRAAVPSLVAAAVLTIPSAVQSQPAPVTRPAPPLQPQLVGGHEIVIYRDRNFDGPAVAIPHDEPNLRLVWTVNSARVRSGTWQLCERPNYQGSCLTLSSSNSNFGHRRVQSARTIRAGSWRELGDADVSRFGWDHRVIRTRGNPSLSAVRLCAERNKIRLRNARASFTNHRFQKLHVPSLLAAGRCTGSLPLTGARRNLSSVEVSVSTLAIGARGRVRLEGR